MLIALRYTRSRLRTIPTIRSYYYSNFYPTLKYSNTFLRYYSESRVMQTLNFDNRALQQLPLDPEPKNYVRTVAGACFSRVKPTPVANPTLVACSAEALALIGVHPDKEPVEDLAAFFSGCAILPGSEPAAHCYCGHQFGYFSGQLGDGATIYLGEVLNASGERWELQLKGAGKTPYSRTADGRKVLRSSIREFLCSEAMFHLGVPTTRAGTCITSDSKVWRDIFYSGNPIEERCTVISRIAPTFIRFGSFEIFKPRDTYTARQGPSLGRNDIKQQLIEYCISVFFPEINQEMPLQERALEFFRKVVVLTAVLVSRWQSVGFCHGVLNTDNMSILGLTIDYGPFGFMDCYNPDFICNSSDDAGRYRFSKQPEICGWNLRKFAEVLDPILPISESMQVLNDVYLQTYEREYLSRMRMKLGLFLEEEGDLKLVESLLDTMHKTGADFTNTFRSLSTLPIPSKAACLDKLLSHCATIEEMKKLNTPKVDHAHLESIMQLLQQTPQLADERLLGQIVNQMDKFNNLNQLDKKSEQQKREGDTSLWTTWLDQYSQRLAQEAGSDPSTANQARVTMMNGCNPAVVLRNYVAQAAIDAAEKGDFSEVNRVFEMLRHPYDPPPSYHAAEPTDAATPHAPKDYSEKPPLSSLGISVT